MKKSLVEFKSEILKKLDERRVKFLESQKDYLIQEAVSPAIKKKAEELIDRAFNSEDGNDLIASIEDGDESNMRKILGYFSKDKNIVDAAVAELFNENFTVKEAVNVVKGLADKTGKSEAEVEKLWDKAKAVASDEYKDVPKDSDRYYQIVTGILKKMLGIED